jgi:hypothetical protein
VRLVTVLLCRRLRDKDAGWKALERWRATEIGGDGAATATLESAQRSRRSMLAFVRWCVENEAMVRCGGSKAKPQEHRRSLL